LPETGVLEALEGVADGAVGQLLAQQLSELLDEVALEAALVADILAARLRELGLLLVGSPEQVFALGMLAHVDFVQAIVVGEEDDLALELGFGLLGQRVVELTEQLGIVFEPAVRRGADSARKI
jgi:hypothetical protein